MLDVNQQFLVGDPFRIFDYEHSVTKEPISVAAIRNWNRLSVLPLYIFFRYLNRKLDRSGSRPLAHAIWNQEIALSIQLNRMKQFDG